MIRVLAILVLVGAASQAPAPRPTSIVVFDTEKGTIEMEVDSARAPATGPTRPSSRRPARAPARTTGPITRGRQPGST